MVEHCANCGAEIKLGILASNQRLNHGQIAVINLANGSDLSAACTKCGGEIFRDAKVRLQRETTNLQQDLRAALQRIPILSLHQPMGWSYEPIGIVTAQTVTGTGLFSDVASAFTDLFGTQSGAYNAKLRDGENLCKDQLRGQAIELGGNAVLAVDVDYAEVGGQRAMLMVCMTGTVVRITALEPPDQDYLDLAADSHRKAKRVRNIERALIASNVP